MCGESVIKPQLETTMTALINIQFMPLQPLELEIYNLRITEVCGYPIDCRSPTSRWPLRFASKMLSYIGIRSEIGGDHICIRVQKKYDSNNKKILRKKEVVTSHY